MIGFLFWEHSICIKCTSTPSWHGQSFTFELILTFKRMCVFLCTITSYSGRNEILQVKKKCMLSSLWASTMISLVIELSTRLINKQLSPPVYFLSSLDHCYLCFNNNSKKKKTGWSFSLYKQTRLNRSVWMILAFQAMLL